MKYTAVVFACCLLFSHCKQKTKSEEILDEFKKVNESLTVSNKKLEENSYIQNYLLIKTNQHAKAELTPFADSLYIAVELALQFTEKLREILRPANEDDAGIVTKLIEGPNGDTLGSRLLIVSDKARLCPIHADKKPALDEALSAIEIIRTDNNWKKRYFDKAPAIVASTILSKFQNDIRNVAGLTMLDMAGQIKK